MILVKIGSSISTEMGDNIITMLTQLFQQQKRVTESGLIAYSGLCCGLQERINVKAFGQYLVWALEGDDEECARHACGIVSDIAGALKEDVQEYLSSFTPQILLILKSQVRERQTKITAISTLGDLSIHSGKSFC